MSGRPTLVLGDLSGPEGNAFVILAACRRALREAGRDDVTVARFTAEATSGDYRRLLEAVGAWFDVQAFVAGLSEEELRALTRSAEGSS